MMAFAPRNNLATTSPVHVRTGSRADSVKVSSVSIEQNYLKCGYCVKMSGIFILLHETEGNSRLLLL